MANRRLFGLVLAGGASRRMGHDKALLQRNGQSQLEYMVALLEKSVRRVFVSTRAEQKDDATRSRFEQIVDRYDNLGPLAGILSAMDEYPDADWLVIACDLPNVDSATLKKLITEQDDRAPFTAFVSSHDGLPEPLCAIFRASSVEILRDFVADGMYCPRKIMIRSDTRLLQQVDPDSLHNVNSPSDLEGSILEVTS